MPRPWDISDLQEWEARIFEKVQAFGLAPYPQEFEICDHEQMLAYMAYSGMPAHYPHWSYGKSFEKQKTLYDYGVSGLPYEMVINSDPCFAYLMRGNSLCLQILTIAHVYGHNDFFANNYMFGDTHADLTLNNFKIRAERVRGYTEDPSIGVDRVEAVLDAAHALQFNCKRHRMIRTLTRDEQHDRLLAGAEPDRDPYAELHRTPDRAAPDTSRLPLEPEDNLLLFIRDHNPALSEWEKDLLTIVHEQAQYFIPQIETKIMNEGWASYWHHRILESLELPADLHLEFLVHHNQVVRPHPGSINPYHVGYRIWEDIIRRYDNPTPREIERWGKRDVKGGDVIFAVREADRDASFIRRFLTEELMRDLDIFEHEHRGQERVVSKVADEDNWQAVKDTLLKNVGMASMPIIRVIDADYGRLHALHVRHEYDGRELNLEYAEHTLCHLHQLWGRTVHLETVISGKPIMLTFDDEEGFHEETTFQATLTLEGIV